MSETKKKKKNIVAQKVKQSSDSSENSSQFDNPDYYFNRELSWLDFNLRCIDNAYDMTNPLLEQMNFLAIASSNLDEFFMVRVSGVYDQYLAHVAISENKTCQTPKELLENISQRNHRNVDKQYKRYHELMPLLANTGYQMKSIDELSTTERAEMEYYFKTLLLPTLSPLGIDAYRPFPHLVNKVINIMVKLKKDGQELRAIVPIPQLIDRYFVIEGQINSIILVEDIIIHHLDDIFEGYEVVAAYPFRITRNADFSIVEDGASDLLVLIEDYVKQRKNGMAVRVEIDKSRLMNFSENQLSYLQEVFDLEDNAVYLIDGPLDLTFLFKLREEIGKSAPQFLFEEHVPFLNPKHLGEDLYTQVKDHDIFLHHPYDSFDPVVNLIAFAAQDPHTIAIKQTLYRVSKNSPIISALKTAAENGKEVTVLVELKARFDEENNVYWAKELEEAGCHVLYGVSELKTHSKISLVIRKENNKIQPYLHLGTGNYNDKTAKIYTDMGLFTTHPGLIDDATHFFNYLSGYSNLPDYKHLHVSPFAIRDSLMDYIDEEIVFQKQYGNGRIIAKMNSLTDVPLIHKLYEASQAGISIDLIVRGICCLKPGIPGISDNIRVRSIVGRFLEHSRIYYFNHNGDNHLFLSSADMMTRNMIKRVEIEFPILDKDIEADIIDYLELQLADNMKARELQVNGDYIRPIIIDDKKINSQEILIERATQRQKDLDERLAKEKQGRRLRLSKLNPDKENEPKSVKTEETSLFKRFLDWLRSL
ncbi:RNA degradosome polyphosphate kinase [Facklamia miroungae]|uniref:Polyphosphate kinase n=1 Tax=Facklamia miroungae TaxID=120956 RepID=A0A1G7RIQ8_9LACT|nr:RNA degradosome polyphosphate kinase [Facklamia miroungae]NKZ29397.1 RNA degradosome polyphosphate kinase [Facklamia miroungae]SDG10696.1 polyphosphate kinase [Facklamia miroungae]